MVNFVSENDDMRKAFNSRIESIDAYVDHALSYEKCKLWFRRFRDNDSNMRNEKHRRPEESLKALQIASNLEWRQQPNTNSKNHIHCTLNNIWPLKSLMGVTWTDWLRRFCFKDMIGNEKWFKFQNPKRKISSRITTNFWL